MELDIVGLSSGQLQFQNQRYKMRVKAKHSGPWAKLRLLDSTLFSSDILLLMNLALWNINHKTLSSESTCPRVISI
jgi:hypothetical protein